jgi:hypothetical protein
MTTDLPNGGFPPIKFNKRQKKKNKDEDKEKGFFYSSKKKIDIRKILENKVKKPIIDNQTDEDLDIIE